jgi:3-dehydroquinate dehydratase-2
VRLRPVSAGEVEVSLDQYLRIVCCPACEGRPELHADGDALVCRECGTRYPVTDGIPSLLAEAVPAEEHPEQSPEAEEQFAPLPQRDLSVLVIHGPNLNLLGTREPEIYGSTTLEDIDRMLQAEALALGCLLRCVQSNHEGEIVSLVQSAREGYSALVINPAAYTHTSVAIRDALSALDCPKVEVHLSNIHAREEFRRVSITGAAVDGIISGFGAESYVLGLRAAVSLARKRA